MNLTSRSRFGPQITTGSMADVSFLLVIFFMVTTVLTVFRGIDLELPAEVEEPQEVEVEHAIDIHVLAGGAIQVDGRAVDLAGVLPYVGAKLEADPAKPVILRTEADASYNDMLRVLDELRQAPDRAGFEVRNLAIPTLREMETFW